MKAKVARWGNSLAIRLPAAWARQIGLQAGDMLELQPGPGGELRLRAASPPTDLAAFWAEVAETRDRMPLTGPTVAAMRDEERY